MEDFSTESFLWWARSDQRADRVKIEMSNLQTENTLRCPFSLFIVQGEILAKHFQKLVNGEDNWPLRPQVIVIKT